MENTPQTHPLSCVAANLTIMCLLSETVTDKYGLNW